MKKSFHYLRPLASIASVALLLYALRRTGIATILDGARELGVGFLLLVVFSGLRHALRAAAWHTSIEPGAPRPGLVSLFGLRLVGEALNGVTPAGPLFGESAKVWVASRWMPVASGAASVLIENLIYGFGVGLFLLSGSVVVLVAMSPRARPASWIAIVGLLASLVALAAILRQRRPLLARLITRLPAASRVRRFLGPYEATIIEVEDEVQRFFRARRAAFATILILEVLTNTTGVGEAYVILKATTVHASLLTSYLVEVANRAVQLFFAFVPFGLGVEEGAAAGTLKSLGYSASQGVSLAVLRRARTVFWAGLGLVLAAHYLRLRTPLKERIPV
jgi:uncharacterized protein (TIRG00374 family)